MANQDTIADQGTEGMADHDTKRLTIHKMLLIGTGGTIANEVSVSKKLKDKLLSAEDFKKYFREVTKFIRETENIAIDMHYEDLFSEDSSDINPDHWKAIIDEIVKEYDYYDSFVITHGTNTLGYTCAALSFGIINPGKPIVLTGSQVPPDLPGSDVKMNIENAVRLACHQKYKIKGVVAVFGSHIITGTRVKKDTEFDYDAFKSFNTGSIGRIGRIIDINKENLAKHNKFQELNGSYATSRANLSYFNDFEAKIVSLTEFPGMKPDLLLELAERYGVKGMVIRAFGAGDLSTVFAVEGKRIREQNGQISKILIPVKKTDGTTVKDEDGKVKTEETTNLSAMDKLYNMGIPVFVTTQAPNGTATMDVNEPGQNLLDNKLVIPAYDMSIESQTTKLMWLLAMQKMDNQHEYYRNFTQVLKGMEENFKGEINPVAEQKIREIS